MFYHVECGGQSSVIDADDEINAAKEFLQRLLYKGEKTFGFLIGVSTNIFRLDDNSRFWMTNEILEELGYNSSCANVMMQLQ